MICDISFFGEDFYIHVENYPGSGCTFIVEGCFGDIL
jgi:hypothetical protein